MKINILNLAGQTEGRYNLGQMQCGFYLVFRLSEKDKLIIESLISSFIYFRLRKANSSSCE